jgi:putative endopeptidase
MKVKTIMTTMLIAAATTGAYAQAQKTGIFPENLDKSVKPCDDFYDFACGGWVKNNPLPAAYSRYGSFDRLQEDNDKRINGILSEMEKGTYAKGTVEQKLSDFYKLAMDQKRRNKEGVKPVMPIIEKMEAAKTKEQLFDIQKQLMEYGDQQFMYMGFGADDKNASQNILNIYQSGLTLGQKSIISTTMRLQRRFVRHTRSTSLQCSNSSASRRLWHSRRWSRC